MAKIDNIIKNLTKDVPTQPSRDILFEFNQAYQRYSNSIHRFDNGVVMTTIEAHMLKHICQNKGVTISDIVNYWGRTKGTVSARVTKLEEKGFVYRKRCENNSRIIHIYPTEKGLETNRRHNRFDEVETSEFLSKWLGKYTADDMYKFVDMLQFYIDVAYSETDK